MPEAKFKHGYKDGKTFFKEKGWQFTSLSGDTGNCGMRSVSSTAGINTKEKFDYVLKNCNTNRLLFDGNVNAVKNIRKWAAKGKYKVLGSFKYHSKYIKKSERTAKNKNLCVLIVEVTPYVL